MCSAERALAVCRARSQRTNRRNPRFTGRDLPDPAAANSRASSPRETPTRPTPGQGAAPSGGGSGLGQRMPSESLESGAAGTELTLPNDPTLAAPGPNGLDLPTFPGSDSALPDLEPSDSSATAVSAGGDRRSIRSGVAGFRPARRRVPDAALECRSDAASPEHRCRSRPREPLGRTAGEPIAEPTCSEEEQRRTQESVAAQESRHSTPRNQPYADPRSGSAGRRRPRRQPKRAPGERIPARATDRRVGTAAAGDGLRAAVQPQPASARSQRPAAVASLGRSVTRSTRTPDGGVATARFGWGQVGSCPADQVGARNPLDRRRCFRPAVCCNSRSALRRSICSEPSQETCGWTGAESRRLTTAAEASAGRLGHHQFVVVPQLPQTAQQAGTERQTRVVDEDDLAVGQLEMP